MHGFLFRPIHQSFLSEVRYVTIGSLKKEKNRNTKLWRSSFGDHGNNALPLSIPELDLIGGVARGLAEGLSVLARSKPGYVKRFERYKQYTALLVNLTQHLNNKMYLFGPTQ